MIAEENANAALAMVGVLACVAGAEEAAWLVVEEEVMAADE